MANEPAPDTPPAPTPEPAAEPGWMAELRQIRDELVSIPGKIKATVSDDDRRGIGQYVYDLFEQGGAFKKDDDEPGEGGDPPADPNNPEPPKPDPGPDQRTIAERLGFPKH